MSHYMTIPPKSYMYGVKFNTYIKKDKKEFLILLNQSDNKFVFNFVSNIWNQIVINEKMNFQIITIPSESKVFYDGQNYYTDTINLKHTKPFMEFFNDPKYTEIIIKFNGKCIRLLDITERLDRLCEMAIQNDINAIIYCPFYSDLYGWLYKYPYFIDEMTHPLPSKLIEKLVKNKRTKIYINKK